ncbi:hypothetical protein [Hyphomicrobium sulfonivorans]|uniref:hypothetical protein n=1 Tax=Hyphomicrobium sulfonivorans TaxID=121290 RepID=UPI00156D8A2E|nr:hypothetical protein [Hyphomicrobium sulfonivorans]MBI1649864.1 hypothetical protein [Hyphomicrobium sulfonivorans]NSL71774.1 hypothetical protein [Hyphomicrobium sulfonivorans]
MRSKTDQIRNAWAAGDKIAALRIASKFFDLSEETMTFQRGYQAHINPAFFKQIGKDPEALTATAISALAAKFKLPEG